MTHTGTVFEHEDSDGDELQVKGWRYSPEDGGRPSLIVTATSHEESRDFQEVSLQEPDVRRLYSALGKWLTENGITMERTPTEVQLSDVRQVVQEEIEAWFTKQTEGGAPFVTSTEDFLRIRTGLTPTVDNLMKLAVDDVTHGGDDCWGSPCKQCGHSSEVHSGTAGCHIPDTSAPDGYCTCTRITSQCSLPVLETRIKRRTCSECGEPWEQGHRTSCAGPLEVREVQTSAPHSGCTCKGHLHELHLDKYACNRTGCFCPNPKQVQS